MAHAPSHGPKHSPKGGGNSGFVKPICETFAAAVIGIIGMFIGH